MNECLEEIGIPELTSEQIEDLCQGAEEAARKYVLSRVSSGKISTLNITIETLGTRPLTVNVDLEVVLSPRMKGYDVKSLTAEATEKAFESIKEYLRQLKCQLKK